MGRRSAYWLWDGYAYWFLSVSQRAVKPSEPLRVRLSPHGVYVCRASRPLHLGVVVIAVTAVGRSRLLFLVIEIDPRQFRAFDRRGDLITRAVEDRWLDHILGEFVFGGNPAA